MDEFANGWEIVGLENDWEMIDPSILETYVQDSEQRTVGSFLEIFRWLMVRQGRHFLHSQKKL